MNDYPAMQRVYRRASLGNEGDRAALLANPEALHLSDDLIRRGRAWAAATGDDVVVGFISTTSIGAGVLELEDLFVDPDVQRRGVARALLANVITEAAGDNAHRLEVTANDHALGFYDAVGFTADGPVETEFGVGTRMHMTLSS